MYRANLTEREMQVLTLAKEYYEKNGAPIPAADLGRRMKIQGGSRQRLLDQMVQKGLVKKVTLGGKKGRPSHGIIPLG